MTLHFDVLPSGDIENDGWTLVAASANTVWEILSTDFVDDCHIRCPSYRGGVEVRFPTDVDDLPDGAVIDSVTVYITMQTNAGSGPRSVTCNVLSSQNRSRYTTRTIYANSTKTTFEVGTYTKDSLGYAWDVQRLNKLRLRLFSYNNLFDSVRIYQLYCRINYHTKPTVTVTGPSGTVNSPSPTVEWSYAQEEGEPQKSAEYKIFTRVAASATAFNPSTAPPVFATTTSGIASSYVIPTSLGPDDYMVFVRATSQHDAVSAWASKQFTVSAPAPGVPGDDNAGLSGIPGVGVPTVVPDNYTSSSAIRMQDTSNLLSVQQADFEIPSDPIGYQGGNATVARDTTQAFANGVASMSITAASAATMKAVSTKIEVAPNQTFTIRGQFLAGATGRTVNLRAVFYDPDFNVLGGSITGTGADATGTWTEVVATGTTPDGCQYMELEAEVVSPANGEVHYVDHMGFMYGLNTAWSDGGHTSRNMLTSFLATAEDPSSVTDSWAASNVATELTTAAASGTGVQGSKAFQMKYIGASPTIAFRAAGTVFTTPSTGTGYTLNKPATVASGDLMVAFVSSSEFGTITPPAGWTAVNTAAIDDGSTDTALWILKRTAGGSEPTSWTTGVVGTSSSRRTAVVVAYSGADHADNQFLAEGVRTDSSGNPVHQTATVVNSDPNAWRIAAFAATDDFSGQSWTANVSPPSTPANISYVGKATAWQQTSDTSSFTLNRPSNVQSGDLLIAGAVFSGKVASVTPPTGWTLVNLYTKVYRGTASGTDNWHTGDVSLAIFKRTAGSSEPSSWTGTHADWGRPKITQVVAYRNADTASAQFIAMNTGSDTDGLTVSTGTVTNTNSRAWRISMFAATSNYGNTWRSGDNADRTDDSTNYSGYPDTVLQISDSNGMVGTGSHSRSARIDESSYFSAIGWIALIKPLAAPPAAGANETSRVNNSNGSANPWLYTAVVDSGGTVATGPQSLYGVLSMTSPNASCWSSASWIGLIKPAGSVTGGAAGAYTSTMIDIGDLDPEALDLAGNRVTMMSTFLGSSAGTPTLTLGFYRANQLISKQTVVGQPFNTTEWVKSWAYFDLPDGTTRIRPEVGAFDRAINDTVLFDRIGVMLGGDTDPEVEPQWRNGTARPEHPVWSKPIIQYQDNDGSGYTDEWITLPGQKIRPPAYDLNTGQMFYVDHTIIPLNARRYRVSTMSYGLRGDIFSSGYGPVSEEAIFEPRSWWLKDIRDLSNNMQILVKWGDMNVTTANTATVFQPLGEQYPIVVTEGLKGDTFSLDIHCEQAEFPALKRMLNSGRTLILQSDIDHMWWVRPVGDVQAKILATGSRTERPRRYVTVTFVQVAPEE